MFNLPDSSEPSYPDNVVKIKRLPGDQFQLGLLARIRRLNIFLEQNVVEEGNVGIRRVGT